MHLKVPPVGGGSSRSVKSGTTAGDSDLLAESCVAESCASFEFVDEDRDAEVQHHVSHLHNEKQRQQEAAAAERPSPPKFLVVTPDGNNSSKQQQSPSSVCSPSGTSEIGSVFGLRFDPQENKMTLQLTAAAGDLVRSPLKEGQASMAPEVSLLQPSRFPLDLNSPTRSEAEGRFPSLKSQAKKSEYENATDDERTVPTAHLTSSTAAAAAAAVATAQEVHEDVRREQEQVRQILASAAALQAETSQSEWSEDDDDESGDLSDDQDECQGPLLGAGRSTGGHHLARNQQNRRRKYHSGFGLASDVESTGYTTDDAGLENFSVFNDAGLTDAEGKYIFSYLKFKF